MRFLIVCVIQPIWWDNISSIEAWSVRVCSAVKVIFTVSWYNVGIEFIGSDSMLLLFVDYDQNYCLPFV